MKAIFLCDDKEMVKKVYKDLEVPKEISLADGAFTKEEVLSKRDFFKDTEIVFSTWGMPSFSKEEIGEIFPSLKAVFYGAGTVKGFAKQFLESGVKVFSAKDANALPVAEFTLAEILLANKNFFRQMRSYDYSSRHGAKGNYRRRIGIVGCGAIGSLVLKMLKGYNFEVVVYDPFLDKKRADSLGVTLVGLEELFSTSDVVTNHLADNDSTKGIFSYEHFISLPEGATFINTGRGAQVAEEDLIRALRIRPDITALLDVTSEEPVPRDSELFTLENCFLTPHIAGSLGDEIVRMGEYMFEEASLFVRGKECSREVTLELFDIMA